jgi:hypothetical protein
MSRRYEFKSSCLAPAILYVCQASRYVAIQLQHYVKLFGSVWFHFNRDTLFLDFGMGFPLQNVYTENDLLMEDLKRVRFLASYACPCHSFPQLARLTPRMRDLERLYLCKPTCPLPPTDYLDLVFTSQCPGFDCAYHSSLGTHFYKCYQVDLHILDCSCTDWTRVWTATWSANHRRLFGIALPQTGLEIFWRRVQSRATKDLLIENAKRIGLDVLP